MKRKVLSSKFNTERVRVDDDTFLGNYSGPAIILNSEGEPTASNKEGKDLRNFIEKANPSEISKLVLQATSKNMILSDHCLCKIGRVNLLLELTAIPEQSPTRRILLLGRESELYQKKQSSVSSKYERYKDLAEMSPDFLWEVDSEGRFVFISSKGGLGYKRSELIGRHAKELVVNPEKFNPFPFLSPYPLDDLEILLRDKNGTICCVIMSSMPVPEVGIDVVKEPGCRGICRNVTKMRENEAALLRVQHREELLTSIVSQIRNEVEPVDILNTAATATANGLGANGSRVYRLIGSQEFVTAAEYGELSNTENILKRLKKSKLKGGVTTYKTDAREFLIALTHYRQKINGAIVIWKTDVMTSWNNDHKLLIGDIAHQLGLVNEQMTTHERIKKLSRTDSLTGLLNRRAFFEQDIPRRIARLVRNGETAAMFFIDMDNLKKINDEFGHRFGDKAILFVRDILLQHSRPTDLVARLGGDEFVVWFDGIDLETSKKRVEQLIKASQSLKKSKGKEISALSLSVGVACFDPTSDETVEELICRADEAMYVAKKAGKGGYFISERKKRGN